MAEAATSEEQKTGYNRDQLVTELSDKLTNPKYHKEFAEAGLGSSLWTNLTKPEELKKALEDLDETDSEWAETTASCKRTIMG